MDEKGLAKDANDPGLMLKKLEILYAMEDAAGFQSYAQQVHGSLSSADSAGWQEVVSMGQRLCPQEDLFAAPAGQQQSGTVSLDSAAVQQAVAAHESDQAEDFASDLAELQAAAPDIDLTGDSETAETQEDYTLEFDLGFADEGEATAEAAELPGQESESSKDDLDLGFDFDFDLEGDGAEKTAEAEGTETTAESDDMSLDFELDQEPPAKTVSEADTNTLRLVPGSESEKSPLDGVEALDFEFETDGSSVGDLGQTAEAAAEAASHSGEAEPEPGFSINIEEEIDTKFELARAYMDLGDGEGAREILTEILAEGAEGQKEEARTLMEKIS
jgi:pilus assembly protein FimV